MKLPVLPGTTVDDFAKRYGVKPDDLKAANALDPLVAPELHRAMLALDADGRKLQGIAALEIGIDLKTAIGKLKVNGSKREDGPGKPAYEFYAVLGSTDSNIVYDYLLSNPATPDSELAKKTGGFPSKDVTLCQEGPVLYGRCPVRLKLIPLLKDAVIVAGAMPGLDLDHEWFSVKTNDPWAIADAKHVLGVNSATPGNKLFDGIEHTLKLVQGRLYWQSPLPDEEPQNPEHDWLVYEALFNAPDYKKISTAMAYGLYAVPLDHRAEVVASNDLPAILANAFFPGMTVQEVQDVSAVSCRWRGDSATLPVDGPSSTPVQNVARTEAVIYAPRMMVMPYNFYANDLGTAAIGTTLAEEIRPGPAYRLKKFWPLWESASRSSVSVLEPTKPEELAKAGRLDAQWLFRTKKQPNGDEITPAYKDKQFTQAHFKNYYSIKTGVRWLGKKAQGSKDPGGGKDVLEGNALLASMRSDWVEHVEETVGKSRYLAILRELLTVTFENSQRNGRDGYQIRDLRPLESDKIYFPPLSIPFGGQKLVDAYNLLHPATTKDFTTFWQMYYARALGRAKAELLLRYGLQLTTPNPQNFLLEFEKATLEPTGKVIMRDIGDAKIHSEVIKTIGKDHPVIQYELTNPNRPGYLPAQTNNEDRDESPQHAKEHERFDFYPLNTRTHWHQYSTFKDQYGGMSLPEQSMTTVEWGREHYRAYLEHLADRLGHPALRGLSIWSKTAYDAVMSTVEDRNKSKSDSAKKILPLALAAAGGDHTKITVTIYRSLLLSKVVGMNDVINAEWALELHTDEALHALLATPEVLAKVKAKWVK